MKILHTSDWHIGRTFHGHPTLDALSEVLVALTEVVRSKGIDVVVVAGDVFDSATPAADAYSVLTTALREIRAAGARVVMTSGNHDSATRLGFQSEFASLAGIHVMTAPERHSQPVTIVDEFGPVHFYGIPFLEPALIRHRYPDAALRTHAQALGFAMDNVRADLAERGGRSIVVSHCFAVATGEPADSSTGLERDITTGGLDLVPASTFDGPDYVALGHIHGRSTLSERVRYSGAPLHYSFAEAGKPRGGWLVELDAHGLCPVEWVALPVPRTLSVLTGDIDHLLADDAYERFADHWVSAVLTDRVRPMDGMRRLHARFPFCATLEHAPSVLAGSSAATYQQRVRAKSDPEIVSGFLEYVRNGVGPSEYESGVISEALTQNEARGASA